jgi:hypothetical protein
LAGLGAGLSGELFAIAKEKFILISICGFTQLADVQGAFAVLIGCQVNVTRVVQESGLVVLNVVQ